MIFKQLGFVSREIMNRRILSNSLTPFINSSSSFNFSTSSVPFLPRSHFYYSTNSNNKTPSTKVIKQKKTIWQKVKEEVIHYKDGFKLLAVETKISSKLLFKMLQGHDLTRREQRQLQRTLGDLKRLIPFLVFVVVPFMEFLLPVFVKLFPNMLPSTFESKKNKELKRQRLFNARLEVQQFLNKTIYENAKLGQYKNPQAAIEFSTLFYKVRNTGERPSVETIIRLSKELKDDITLDDLPRSQLVSLCKYLNIKPFYSDAILKIQIRNKMRYLRADDRMINAEGVESLTEQELVNACQQRGISTYNVSKERMQEDLKSWLTLNLKHQVPIILLIMAQSFALPDAKSSFTVEALHNTLISLPEDLIREAQLDVSNESGAATTPKEKLKVIEEQQDKITEEQLQKDEEKREKEKMKNENDNLNNNKD